MELAVAAIILAVIIWLAWRYLRQPAARHVDISPPPASPGYGVELRASRVSDPTLLAGDHHVDVVGESSYQPALAKVARQRSPIVATLVREPANPYDPNAVRVDIGGQTVGYIPRHEAASLHPLLDRLAREGRPARVGATLKGGGSLSWGVDLDGLPHA